MARNFYRIFIENNPVMGDSKTFGIPKAKGLTKNPHFETYYSKIQKTQVFRILTHCIGFPMKFWSRINMKYSSIGIVKF